MATRVYFPEATAAPVTVTPPAGWTHDSGVRRKLTLRTPGASTLVTTDYAPDTADHLAAGAALLRQYVSDPLAAQTIAGTLIGQLQCLEDHANNNLGLSIALYTVTTTGSAVTHTLLATVTQQVTEINTTLRNQTLASLTLTSATIAAGERLVIELGLGGTPGPATGGVQGHNGQIRWGETASSGDLPIDSTTTATTYRPWLEFSATLGLFITPATLPDTLALNEQLTPVITRAAAAVKTHWTVPHFADAQWTLRHWVGVSTRRLVQEPLALTEQLFRTVTSLTTTRLGPLGLPAQAYGAMTGRALSTVEDTQTRLGPAGLPAMPYGTFTGRVAAPPRIDRTIPTEPLALTESLAKQIPMVVTEGLIITEASVSQKLAPLPPPEGVPLIERLTVPIRESVGVAETLTKRVARTVTDGLGVAELLTSPSLPRVFPTSHWATAQWADAQWTAQHWFTATVITPTFYSHWAAAHWTQQQWMEVTALGAIERTVPESLGLGEALTKRVNLARTLSDPLAVTDSLTAKQIRPAPVSDVLAVTETLRRVPLKLVSEPLTLTESLHAAYSLHLAEPLGLSEGLARSGVALISLGDALGVAESLTAVVRTAISDPLALTETLGKAAALASAREPLGLGEQLTRQLVRGRAAQDSLGLTEALTPIVSLGLIVRTLSDTLVLNDTLLTPRVAYHRLLAESVALEEQILRDGQSLVIVRHYLIQPAIILDGSTTAPRIVLDYRDARMVVDDEEGILV